MLSIASGLHPPSARAERWMRRLDLEHGLIAGLVLIAVGLAGSLRAALGWASGSFGDLDPFEVMRTAIPSALLLTLGFQVACSSFFFSLLKLQRRYRDAPPEPR